MNCFRKKCKWLKKRGEEWRCLFHDIRIFNPIEAGIHCFDKGIVLMTPIEVREKIKSMLYQMANVIPFSKNAVELLFLTACVESDCGRYRRQVGGGPAIGIFQMEPISFCDIYRNYLPKRTQLQEIVISIAFGNNGIDGMWGAEAIKIVEDNITFFMEYHIGFQVAMARIHYWRKAEPLPELKFRPIAEYWKKHYNTTKGRGTVQEALIKYKHYLKEIYG